MGTQSEWSTVGSKARAGSAVSTTWFLLGVFLVTLGQTGVARAGLLPDLVSVALRWDPSPSPGVAAYRIYYGPASRVYLNHIETGPSTSGLIPNLLSGVGFFFAVTAVSTNGLESDFSNEVGLAIPLSITLPTVALTAPAGGSSYLAPANVGLSASVVPNGHTIAKVQFYGDSTLIGESTAAPFLGNWNNLGAGSFGLTAVAIFDGNNAVTSAPVNITITNPLPQVTLVAPVAGASYGAPAMVTLAANVIPNGHTISKVQYFNGASLLGEGVIAPYSIVWSNVSAGTYSVLAQLVYDATKTIGTPAVTVAVTNVVPTLAEALDTPGWNWGSGGPGGWAGQRNVTHDGVDAARSAAMGDYNTNWMETTLDGPGSLSFWWKVSSEATYDFLRFSVDGVEQMRITGEVDWQARSIALQEGRHTVRWAYTKDEYVKAGQDAGWVDQVVFTGVAPTVVAGPSSQTIYGGGTVNLGVVATGTPAITYQWQLNGVDLTNGGRWSGVTSSNLLITGAQASDSGSYTVMVGNSWGRITSGNASVTVLVLTPPWQTQDIGSPNVAGSAFSFGNLFVVSGVGNISGGNDNFRFLYQTMSADGDLVCRINSRGTTGSGERIGIMLRESLTSTATYAYMGIADDGSFRWQCRTNTGGLTYGSNGAFTSPPDAWVRLTRTGNVLRGQSSLDGTNWSPGITVTIPMAVNVYAGLAVASGVSDTLNSAVYSSVVVTP